MNKKSSSSHTSLLKECGVELRKCYCLLLLIRTYVSIYTYLTIYLPTYIPITNPSIYRIYLCIYIHQLQSPTYMYRSSVAMVHMAWKPTHTFIYFH